MRRALLLAGIAGAILAGSADTAYAHPLGNFTVNRASALTVSGDTLPGDTLPGATLTVDYAVDLAEVPTFREFAGIDSDRNGKASSGELAAWARGKADFVSRGLRVVVDGTVVRARPIEQSAATQRGEGGLQTLRLDVGLVALLPKGARVVSFEDLNFSSFPGWKEVVASGDIASADVPSRSMSEALRAYPKSAMRRPPAITTAQLTLSETGGAATAPIRRSTPSERNTSVFSGLIERDLTVPSVAIALLLAAAVGAFHALGPGHGKTVMAGYVVGARAPARDAVLIGLTVAAMHTVSVVALGLATLVVSNVFSPASVYPWLTLVSGVSILALGAWMFLRRRRANGHHHAPDVSPLSRRGLIALAASGGLVPSPSAVVVLLGAVSLRRVAFGLVLVGAFSVGLAAALSAVGIMTTRAGAFAERRWGHGSLVPSLSNAGIVAMGAFLTVRATLALV